MQNLKPASKPLSMGIIKDIKRTQTHTDTLSFIIKYKYIYKSFKESNVTNTKMLPLESLNFGEYTGNLVFGE